MKSARAFWRRTAVGAAVLGAAALGFAPSAAWAQAAEVEPANVAWVLTASALVLFMTLPGLALFYGGLVRMKNVLSTMMQCVAITCVISLLWLAIGYSLAFDGAGHWIGGAAKAFLPPALKGEVIFGLPEPVFFLFQLTFAIITPALIVGAFVERIKFQAVVAMSALWLLLVYAPVAHWVWGGGWLAQQGVLDFAGGLVVHATAGASALVIAAMLGPRDGFPAANHPPHNPGMTLIGAGMLWVGWYGFNGGSALTASGDAANAIIATHMSASAAAIAWCAIEWVRFQRPSLIGAVTGAVAGLATVTPASGFIGPMGGVALGLAGGVVCFFAVDLVKRRLKIDDSLDVFAVHGVGGVLGTLLLAVFCSAEAGGVGYREGYDAGSQFSAQALGAAAVLIYSAIATAIIVLVVKAALGLRATEEHIRDGLDLSHHGERAQPDTP